MYVPWFPAKQVPKPTRMKLPDIVGFKKPHSLTAGLEGTSAPEVAEGIRQWSPGVCTGAPIGLLLKVAVTGKPPS